MRKLAKYIFACAIAVCGLAGCSVGPDEVPEPPCAGSRITSFTIAAEANGLDEPLTGTIDHKEHTIGLASTDLIRDPRAVVVELEAEGTVTVDGTEISGGMGLVDFFGSGGSVEFTVTDSHGHNNSYTASIDSPVFSGLPVVSIDIDDGKEITQKTETYYGAEITLLDPAEWGNDLEMPIGIRIRGNTSAVKPKKPWRIHFDEPIAVLGLAEARSWVLLANWQDPTLIMNEVAFELGRRFGIPHTNNSRFVELWINGSYRGNYQLTEQVQAGRNRIAVNSGNGGFLAELDKYYDSEPRFRTPLFDLPVMIREPETQDGLKDIKQFFNDMERAVDKGGWREYIDEASLIDYMLVTELVRNSELAHPKSLFVYRRGAESKLCFGPPWDYDWSFGYAADGSFDYFRPKTITVLYSPRRDAPGYDGLGFICRFYKDPDFIDRYKLRWNSMMDSGEIESITAHVDYLSAALMRSQRYNFERWPNKKDYPEQIAMLKQWLSDRIVALDREINEF